MNRKIMLVLVMATLASVFFFLKSEESYGNIILSPFDTSADYGYDVIATSLTMRNAAIVDTNGSFSLRILGDQGFLYYNDDRWNVTLNINAGYVPFYMSADMVDYLQFKVDGLADVLGYVTSLGHQPYYIFNYNNVSYLVSLYNDNEYIFPIDAYGVTTEYIYEVFDRPVSMTNFLYAVDNYIEDGMDEDNKLGLIFE